MAHVYRVMITAEDHIHKLIVRHTSVCVWHGLVDEPNFSREVLACERSIYRFPIACYQFIAHHTYFISIRVSIFVLFHLDVIN